MKISQVRVRRSLVDNKVKALASVTFDEELVVHEIRVVEGQNGIFVSFPSRRTSGGKYLDLAHPVTAEARQKIQSAVLNAYGEWLRERQAQEKAEAERAEAAQQVQNAPEMLEIPEVPEVQAVPAVPEEEPFPVVPEVPEVPEAEEVQEVHAIQQAEAS